MGVLLKPGRWLERLFLRDLEAGLKPLAAARDGGRFKDRGEMVAALRSVAVGMGLDLAGDVSVYAYFCVLADHVGLDGVFPSYLFE